MPVFTTTRTALALLREANEKRDVTTMAPKKGKPPVKPAMPAAQPPGKPAPGKAVPGKPAKGKKLPPPAR